MHSYIITTDDFSAGLKKIEEIKKTIREDLDEVTYDLEEDGMYAVIDELTTVSLFDNPKMVIVKSGEEILNTSDKKLTELCVAMNDTNSENVLVILITKSFDMKNEKYQKVKRFASTIDIRIKNLPMDKLAIRELEAEGYKIDNEALSLLCSYSTNLSALLESINILKCYKMDDKRITTSDVSTMVKKPLDNNVYELIEAVLHKDKKRIFQTYNDLRIINMQPSYLVSLLINKFQELYNVFILVKGGLDQTGLAEVFNVSSGRAYYMMKNVKNTNIKDIKRNLDLLNQLELDIKSGKIDQSLGLELYFLK